MPTLWHRPKNEHSVHIQVFIILLSCSFPLHLPHLPLSRSPSLSSFSAPAAAAAAPEPERRVPSPPCTGRDKRPDSPAEHCPLSPSVPSCTTIVVVVVLVEVVVVAGASGENEAWTRT